DRDARLVGAVAALAGMQAAVDEANRLPPADRRSALLGAGRALIALGRFGPAADLMAQAGDGGDVKVSAVIAALRRMDKRETKSSPDDPRSLIQAILRLAFAESVEPAQVREMYSRHERELDEKGGPRSALAEIFKR